MTVSGSFKVWARELKDYARMADPKTLSLFRDGETAKEKIDLEFIDESQHDLDRYLHYLICKLLDGDAKMLALNAEIGDFDKEHKSRSELWRLLVLN